ncbi:hypothetical protein G6F22_019696 [Rhizopus arrhizus]|nr:hypothetical protein G6F22_019696 [Rhizopus arrhizus]
MQPHLRLAEDVRVLGHGKTAGGPHPEVGLLDFARILVDVELGVRTGHQRAVAHHARAALHVDFARILAVIDAVALDDAVDAAHLRATGQGQVGIRIALDAVRFHVGGDAAIRQAMHPQTGGRAQHGGRGRRGSG